ncbi:hypothetical protein [Streptomyces sp. NRRL F-2890]|uniref:hypothetical protein n=1 Tax=Streptomyces sp. NRRL F-2890 TaxID=1463845 RepID=UPI0004CAA7FB|nr:hypothetical protein [Streptomyces sp. NRRL F-2890]
MTSRSNTSSTATPDTTWARRRAPHNPNVYVVQATKTGEWVADCCDPRCGFHGHNLATSVTKGVAEAAATRHRRFLGTLPAPPHSLLRPYHCESCGQAQHAIEELQDLVAELEARLAKYESP